MKNYLSIAILTLVIIGGAYIIFQIFTPTTTEQKENNKIYTPGKVAISTNKMEYNKGEVIEFTVSNSLDKSIIFIGPGSSPWTRTYIEKKTNNEWSGQDLNIFIAAPTIQDPPAKWIDGATILESGKEYINAWSQQVNQYKGNDGVQVKEGTYRIKLVYYTFTVSQADLWGDINDWNEADKYQGISYSNDFIIK